jgi:hypothetical protein
MEIPEKKLDNFTGEIIVLLVSRKNNNVTQRGKQNDQARLYSFIPSLSSRDGVEKGTPSMAYRCTISW